MHVAIWNLFNIHRKIWILVLVFIGIFNILIVTEYLFQRKHTWKQYDQLGEMSYFVSKRPSSNVSLDSDQPGEMSSFVSKRHLSNVSMTCAFTFQNICINVTSPTFTSKLAVGILSAPTHFKQRQWIRETWARFTGDWSYAFLLGLPYNEEHQNENATHKDMLLVDKNDIYDKNNSLLPLKVFSFFNTISRTNVSWVFKTDDDSFLNIPLLLKFISNRTRPFYGGLIYKNATPIRKPYAKWYVSRDQFAGEKYVDYAAGAGYLISTDLLECFMKYKSLVEKMPIEEIMVGMLVDACSVKASTIPKITHNIVKDNLLWLLINGLKEAHFLRIWKKVPREMIRDK